MQLDFIRTYFLGKVSSGLDCFPYRDLDTQPTLTQPFCLSLSLLLSSHAQTEESNNQPVRDKGQNEQRKGHDNVQTGRGVGKKTKK